MKGGFAALVGALHLLREKGANPPRDLLLAVVPDEEVGGPISYASGRGIGANARTVFVLEPGAPTEDGETLVTGRRGLTVWRLDAKGRAAHSGVGYWEGRSALAAAAAWAGEVQSSRSAAGGPVVNVGRIVGGDSEFVSRSRRRAPIHRDLPTSQRGRRPLSGRRRSAFPDPLDGVRVINEMRVMAREIARLLGSRSSSWPKWRISRRSVHREPSVAYRSPGCRRGGLRLAARTRKRSGRHFLFEFPAGSRRGFRH